MTLRIMLYNPKTEAPVGKFSWAEIAEMIGDDLDKLPRALELFERNDGLMLAKLISAFVHPHRSPADAEEAA